MNNACLPRFEIRDPRAESRLSASPPEPCSSRGRFRSLLCLDASASGGMDALLGRGTLAGLAAADPGSGSGAGSDAEHGIGFRATARW